MQSLLKWLPLISLLANAVMAWVCWSMRQLAKTEVTTLIDAAVARLQGADEKLGDQVDDHEARINRIEAGLQNVATKADIAGIKAEISGLEKQIGGVDAGVTRIEQYLLERTR